MFIFGVIFLIVALLLIGAGFAIGILVFGVAAAAIGLGVISTSVACGFIQKKSSIGFRVFFYQFFIIAFLFAGILTAWLVSLFADLHVSIISVILIGSISGGSVGLIFGLLHSWIVDLISGYLIRIFSRMTNSA